MHNVDFCWYTCVWIHKYVQVQNCGPWGVPCSHCFCNSVKSTWWEWKTMCWGRVGDYEYLAKYSGKFQKYFSIQVNKRIHPPNFHSFATSLCVCCVFGMRIVFSAKLVCCVFGMCIVLSAKCVVFSICVLCFRCVLCFWYVYFGMYINIFLLRTIL